MYRKIMNFLETWRENKHRKPLILQGARQVGKTYSILEFGRKHYDNVAYFNFETNPRLNQTFEENISPDYLIPILSHIAGQTIVREKTLIVFDEVQLCERALTSLKYFCEDAPDYHIIVAGSLLGVAVNRVEFSFPVGKVDMKTMYPMDVEEFMLALGEEMLVAQIRKSFETNMPLASALHDVAMQLYRQYLVVGGMPECVMQFAQTRDYILVRHTQDTILASYLNDMSKYNNLNEIKKNFSNKITFDYYILRQDCLKKVDNLEGKKKKKNEELEKEIRKEVHKVKTNKVKPGYKKKIKKAIEKAKANHKKKIIQKNIKEKKKSSR